MINLKHIWTVLCKKSVIDNETNNISLYEILERLQINVGQQVINKMPKNIVVPFDFEVISFMGRKDYSGKTLIKAEIRLQIYDPENSVIGKMERKFDVTPDVKRIRLRLRSPNINVTTSGQYRFLVSIKEDGEEEFTTVAEMPLEVEKVSEIKIKKNMQI